MKRRRNNKILLLILGALLALYFISEWSDKSERTFRTELVTIDTAQISSILLYPKAGKHEEIRFTKENNVWMVHKGAVKARTRVGAVEGLLTQLLQIKPKRLAAKSKDKWVDFQLNDTLATRIKVQETKGKESLDLMIGKFSYQQNPNPYGGGRNNVSGTSYVRLAAEEEIYAVDGFLTFSFNQPFSAWRDQTFLKANKEDLIKLSFEYPGDTGFVVIKQDSVWIVDGAPADSLQMENYLNLLANRTNAEFEDGFTAPAQADYRLTVEGNNMAPLVITSYRSAADDSYILHSSLNPGVYFKSNASDIFADIFKPRAIFTGPGES